VFFCKNLVFILSFIIVLLLVSFFPQALVPLLVQQGDFWELGFAEVVVLA